MSAENTLSNEPVCATADIPGPSTSNGISGLPCCRCRNIAIVPNRPVYYLCCLHALCHRCYDEKRASSSQQIRCDECSHDSKIDCIYDDFTYDPPRTACATKGCTAVTPDKIYAFCNTCRVYLCRSCTSRHENTHDLNHDLFQYIPLGARCSGGHSRHKYATYFCCGFHMCEECKLKHNGCGRQPTNIANLLQQSVRFMTRIADGDMKTFREYQKVYDAFQNRRRFILNESQNARSGLAFNVSKYVSLVIQRFQDLLNHVNSIEESVLTQLSSHERRIIPEMQIYHKIANLEAQIRTTSEQNAIPFFSFIKAASERAARVCTLKGYDIDRNVPQIRMRMETRVNDFCSFLGNFGSLYVNENKTKTRSNFEKNANYFETAPKINMGDSTVQSSHLLRCKGKEINDEEMEVFRKRIKQLNDPEELKERCIQLEAQVEYYKRLCADMEQARAAEALKPTQNNNTPALRPNGVTAQTTPANSSSFAATCGPARRNADGTPQRVRPAVASPQQSPVFPPHAMGIPGTSNMPFPFPQMAFPGNGAVPFNTFRRGMHPFQSMPPMNRGMFPVHWGMMRPPLPPGAVNPRAQQLYHGHQPIPSASSARTSDADVVTLDDDEHSTTANVSDTSSGSEKMQNGAQKIVGVDSPHLPNGTTQGEVLTSVSAAQTVQPRIERETSSHGNGQEDNIVEGQVNQTVRERPGIVESHQLNERSRSPNSLKLRFRIDPSGPVPINRRTPSDSMPPADPSLAMADTSASAQTSEQPAVLPKVEVPEIDVGPSSDGWDDYCYICSEGCDELSGDLGCCSGCPRVYHQLCHIPNCKKPMAELPDDWKCSLCLPLEPIREAISGFSERARLVCYSQVEDQFQACAKILLRCYAEQAKAAHLRVFPGLRLDDSTATEFNAVNFEHIARKIAGTYTDISQFMTDMNAVFMRCSKFYAPDSISASNGRDVYSRFRKAVQDIIPPYSKDVWMYVNLYKGEVPKKKRKLN